MTVTIHPAAVVDPAARLGVDVAIGPFCVVGPHVTLGDRTRLVSHVALDGRTSVGEGTIIYPFASIGHPPQDLKFRNEESQLIIGRNNTIREHTTMNPGTEGGGMVTRVGDNCLFMMSTHVAHDCQVGNHVILANNATLAGHVAVGDHAILGGLAAVHQFVRIGAHAMIGGLAGVEADVIPYGLVKGDRAYLAGLNLVGLERRGFSREAIGGLRAAFKQLFHGERTMAERLQDVGDDYEDNLLVKDIVAFLNDRSSRAVTLPR